MINKKLNKLIGIQSIVLSILFLISNIVLLTKPFPKSNYEIFKEYLSLVFFLILIIITLISSCYLRYHRKNIKQFSFKTTVGFFSKILSLYIMIISKNKYYASQISSIILLIGGIIISSKENNWKTKLKMIK